jgi:Amt family ammonium transporter
VGVPNLGGLYFLDKEVAIPIAGTNWGLIGYKGFFLGPDVLDVGVAVLFLFQMVFMDTAATILTGAAAERWTWVSFCLWGVFVGGFMYPIFANWAWGGGWLSQLGAAHLGKGYLDFAGSGVVHSQGGWAGLGAAVALGPRLGKYNRDGSPNPMPGHNLNMAALGCFILAFGWFGFNPGSTLGASGSGNLRIGIIATNTMLAGAAASLSAMFYGKATLGKWDPGYMMNGLLAGLVAITAPSGWVSPISSVLIGLVAGVLVCYSMGFFERVLHVDDPVGAISVHGVNGAWGVLALGLLADGTANYGGLQAKGLFFGDPGQLAAQIVGMVVVFVWCFGTSYAFFSILKAIGILRSKPADELAGLDLPEMGTSAYPLDPGIPPDAGRPIPGGGWISAAAAGG